MISSRISSLLRGQAQYTATYAGIVHKRLSSTAVESNSNNLTVVTDLHTDELPDKLYRKIILEVRANNPDILNSYGMFVKLAAEGLDINFAQSYAPKKPVLQRWNLLKSVFVHKKHQVHYEIRTYYRYLTLMHLTGSTADTFLEYVERNLPEGVAMKVTKHELQKLPMKIE